VAELAVVVEDARFATVEEIVMADMLAELEGLSEAQIVALLEQEERR
jgi:hypothetical protein